MKLLTTGELATELHEDEPRIRDLLRRGKIQEPALRAGGRRLFNPSETEAARDVVKKNKRGRK